MSAVLVLLHSDSEYDASAEVDACASAIGNGLWSEKEKISPVVVGESWVQGGFSGTGPVV